MASGGTHMTAVLGAIGKGALSIDAIAEHLPMSRRNVSNAAARLIGRGMIERRDRGVFGLTGAGLAFVEDGGSFRPGPSGRRGADAPARRMTRDTFRQRAWNAMRIRQRFTVGDICMLAATAADGKPERNLQAWFKALAAVGILVERVGRAAGNAVTSPGHKVWMLHRDTGPQAPVLRETGVFDANTGELLPWP